MADLPHFARWWMVARKPTGPGSKTEPRQRYNSRADARAAFLALLLAALAAFLVMSAVSFLSLAITILADPCALAPAAEVPHG